ncbi:T9SS type A sorting domain-containing protein [Polluticoccus soli]|uniref:T9SS type A sorting domain-containing protein n=1 Tax=Polluticoccus soli TaxID=3034150 RepID=UPI0023E1EE37|nr:T9SS type A sorting domain-containing protein [Flavipsychrobacter sp. JY13-12]
MKYLLPLLLVFCCLSSNAQNIVPNGDFEYYTPCPNTLGQVNNCTGWRQYTGGTSDYYNTCATTTTYVGIPANLLGFQYAASGNAYTGVITYTYNNLTGPANYKEYIATSISPLQAGKHYEASMSVSLADTAGWASNDLGMFFYDSGPNTVSGTVVLPVTPQVSFSSYGNITDEINWTRLSAIFTADSAYDNLVIGGFTHFSSLNPTYLGGTGSNSIHSYYFIDSVFIKQVDTLEPRFSGTLLCGTDSFSINYFVLPSVFNAGNVFTVQLSNASGSFATPINIGTKASSTSGTIKVGLPASLTPGAGYRIRLVATNIPFVSADNGKDIAIGMTLPAKPIAASNSPVCYGDTLKLSATVTGTITGWLWTGPNNFTSTLSNPVINSATTVMSGNYIAKALKYGCVSSDTETVSIVQKPSLIVATSNAPLCIGDTLKLSGNISSPGTTYSWTGPNSFWANTRNTDIAPAGTIHNGDYVITGTLNGCTVKDTVTVAINSKPVGLVATSSSPVCENDTLKLYATATTTGVTYSWSGPLAFNSAGQNPQIFSATGLNTGNYTVTCSNGGCLDKDTVYVQVKALPTPVIAGNNGPVCPNTSINLSANNTIGATYNWTGPLSFASSQQNPVINNATFSHGGTYSVTATVNGCTSLASTTTVIVATPAATYTAGSNSPVCAGGNLNLNVTNMAGASFTWSGPNGFAATAQNPAINPVSVNDGGIYSVYATLNGCQYPAVTTNVTVTTISSLAIYPSPNDTLCINNANATFVAAPFNAGTAPQYQWFKNNTLMGGATNLSYPATGIANGDSFYCRMTVTGLCADPLVLYSNKVGMTVLPLTAGPTVSITADPGTLLSPWQLVKFTAVATNAGTLPKYQWKRNGQDVIGATSNVWSANNLSNLDTISCIVTSDVWCASPSNASSNRMVVNIKTGISDIDADRKLELYPNPNNGSFVVNIPTFKGGSLRVDVVDALGRTVYRDQLQTANHQLEVTLPASVANGVYMLKLAADGAVYHARFTVGR